MFLPSSFGFCVPRRATCAFLVGAVILGREPPPAAPPEIAFNLGKTTRAFQLDEQGRFSTVRIDGTGASFAVLSQEFHLELADGETLEPKDFSRCELNSLPQEFGARGAALRFSSEEQPYAVTLVYFSVDDEPWMWKQLRLEVSATQANPPRLATVELERLGFIGQVPWSGGGIGFPASNGQGAFLSVDHPFGEVVVEGAIVKARHAPESEPGPAIGEWRSYPWSARAVLGASLPGSEAATFARLLDGLRRPAKACWVWSAGAGTHGASADGALTDGAFTNTAALHADLASLLKSLDTDHPWRPTLLQWDTAAKGALRSDSLAALIAELPKPTPTLAISQSLVDPEGATLALEDDAVKREVQKSLLARVQDAAGKRKLVGAIDSHVSASGLSEARANALFELWRTERRLVPELTILLSGLLAPVSPWWLTQADLLRVEGIPPFEGAERGRTGFDATWFAALQQGLGALPPSAVVMSRPLMPTALENPSTPACAEAADLDDALFLVASSQPWRTLSGKEAPKLARSSLVEIEQWKTARADLLAHARPVGGAPEAGAIYGLRMGADRPRILLLRNPSARPQKFELPAPQQAWVRTYPWCEVIPGGSLTVELAPFETAVIEASENLAPLQRIPAGVRFIARSRAEGKTQFDLLLAPQSTHAYDWLDLGTGARKDSGAVGASGAVGLRDSTASFAPTLRTCALTPDGQLKLELLANSRGHRGEELEFLVVITGATAPGAAVPALSVPGKSRLEGGRHSVAWQVTLEESRVPAELTALLPLSAGADANVRVTIVAARHFRLEPVRVFSEHLAAPKALPAMPPQERALTASNWTLLFDGPLPAAPRAAESR